MLTDATRQRICIWCAVPFGLLFFVGLLLAGWLPPPSPSDPAAVTAQHYAEYRNGILAGSLIIMFAGTLCVPFSAAIASQIRRVESRLHPIAYVQLGAGAVVAVGFIIPTFFWVAAAFYPGVDPALLRILTAAGWLPMMGAIPPAILQNLSIAVAALADRNSETVFPRWVGYFNIWVSLLFLPAGLVFFFHDGPFAWNGTLTFWLAAPVFGVWLIVMLVVVLRAIGRQEAKALARTPELSAT
jgi:hypothetical protein